MELSVSNSQTPSEPQGKAQPIGKLVYRCGRAQQNHHLYIYSHFLIGRDSQECSVVLDDPKVSNHHMRVHVIPAAIAQDAISAMPLVYAENFSATNGMTLKSRSRITPSQHFRGRSGAILLNHGEELQIGQHTFTYQANDPSVEQSQSLNEVQHAESKFFRDSFSVSPRKLGTGSFGTVYLAHDKISGAQLACKVVDLRVVKTHRECLTGGDRPFNDFLEEFKILKDVNHPNIVKFEKVYHSENTLFIFQDLVTAGDLFTYLEFHNGVLQDVHSALVIRQILTGVEYLHEKGIVHRDLRLENILVTRLSPNARMIITDFGHAKTVVSGCRHRQIRLYSKLGALEYVAPEVYGLNSNGKAKATAGYFGKSADMYSIGSIVYKLLRGDKPFKDEKDERWPYAPGQVIIERAGRLDHESANKPHQWTNTSANAKDFISKLFKKDPIKRMSAKQALEHAWVANDHVKKHFELLYTRAKADWTPATNLKDPIEPLRAPIEKTPLPKNTNANPAPFTFRRDSSVSTTASEPSTSKLAESTSRNHVKQTRNCSSALVSNPKKGGVGPALQASPMPPPLLPASQLAHPYLPQSSMHTSSPDPLHISSSVSGPRAKLGQTAYSRSSQQQLLKRSVLENMPSVSTPKDTPDPMFSAPWSSDLSSVPESFSPLPALQQQTLSMATTASASFPPWTQNRLSQASKQARSKGNTQAQAQTADQPTLGQASAHSSPMRTRSQKRRHVEYSQDVNTQIAGGPETTGVAAGAEQELNTATQSGDAPSRPNASRKSQRIQPPRAAATQQKKQSGVGKLRRLNKSKKKRL